jgi:hypothetical protein
MSWHAGAYCFLDLGIDATMAFGLKIDLFFKGLGTLPMMN